MSVVIPTLNEESTVGAIVKSIRRACTEESSLVDEIIVMDSGSSDATVAVAEAAGATVYAAAEVAEEWGNHPGKGENLWKSQFVTNGTICVFVDADILNFHPGYISGLVGPLLENEEVHYVKAFYQRPLQVDGEPLEQEGGRVSEILMRPLFSLFYPELCAFHQPLAGEYAVRRSLLEKLSFPTGYAVEAAHLIDVLSLCGMSAFAQCDLDSRLHRNRPLEELGAMSCTILHTVVKRAERDGLLRLPRGMGDAYIRHVASDQSWNLTKKPVTQVERCAISSLHAASTHP